jgi:hypothetical protein
MSKDKFVSDGGRDKIKLPRARHTIRNVLMKFPPIQGLATLLSCVLITISF